MSLVVELAVWSSTLSLNLLFTLSQAKKWGAKALGPPMVRALDCIDHYNAHKELNYIHGYTIGKNNIHSWSVIDVAMATSSKRSSSITDFFCKQQEPLTDSSAGKYK